MNCQLSECLWSDWSNKQESCGIRSCVRTKTNPESPKYGGRSCEKEAGCYGQDCWKSQTESMKCVKHKSALFP